MSTASPDPQSASTFTVAVSLPPASLVLYDMLDKTDLHHVSLCVSKQISMTYAMRWSVTELTVLSRQNAAVLRERF